MNKCYYNNFDFNPNSLLPVVGWRSEHLFHYQRLTNSPAGCRL